MLKRLETELPKQKANLDKLAAKKAEKPKKPKAPKRVKVTPELVALQDDLNFNIRFTWMLLMAIKQVNHSQFHKETDLSLASTFGLKNGATPFGLRSLARVSLYHNYPASWFMLNPKESEERIKKTLGLTERQLDAAKQWALNEPRFMCKDLQPLFAGKV